MNSKKDVLRMWNWRVFFNLTSGIVMETHGNTVTFALTIHTTCPFARDSVIVVGHNFLTHLYYSDFGSFTAASLCACDRVIIEAV